MSAERMAWRPLRWLISRRAAKALLWAAVIVAAAVGANIAGIYLVGSVAGWERWLAAASGYFFVWRLFLYGATACGWSLDAAAAAGARGQHAGPTPADSR